MLPSVSVSWHVKHHSNTSTNTGANASSNTATNTTNDGRTCSDVRGYAVSSAPFVVQWRTLRLCMLCRRYGGAALHWQQPPHMVLPVFRVQDPHRPCFSVLGHISAGLADDGEKICDHCSTALAASS